MSSLHQLPQQQKWEALDRQVRLEVTLSETSDEKVFCFEI